MKKHNTAFIAALTIAVYLSLNNNVSANDEVTLNCVTESASDFNQLTAANAFRYSIKQQFSSLMHISGSKIDTLWRFDNRIDGLFTDFIDLSNISGTIVGSGIRADFGFSITLFSDKKLVLYTNTTSNYPSWIIYQCE